MRHLAKISAAIAGATLCVITIPTISQAAPPGSPHGISSTRVTSTESAASIRAASRVTLKGPAKNKTLKVKVQAQANNYFCAPASGRVALSALVSRLPSQATIAKRMHTTRSGTMINNIAPALNASQKKHKYVTAANLSLDAFRKRIKLGIGSHGAPAINAVEMSDLPWYKGTGISGGHAISTYGFHTAVKTWKIDVYDPWDATRHKGTHSGVIYDASIAHSLIW